ncbi:FadR/GntR family transcriptional regulator [Tropicimonas sp. IMCC34011]|uniref:FadR/GntR family transcriptional regulator n=1 Tax=Tropicimonas sp. IMCC34011 TaxID=2248759 RepID=UPI0021015755|nr:FadR/GntR family transcriptional regulator [Tropicimonas sp. IMCC34011]
MSRQPPARGASLVTHVATEMRDRIQAGEFAPGQMLPPLQSMADSWNVSRTVVREALSQLSSEGLIHSRQGLGVFIPDVLPPQKLELPMGGDPEDIIRILEIRLGSETEAAFLAARRCTTEDLETMRDALVRMDNALAAGDVKSGIDADLDFHRAICAGTRNPHFVALFNFLSQFLSENITAARHNSATLAGRGADAQAEHRTLFKAIEAGDFNGARRSARTHVLMTGRRLGLTLDDGELAGDD